MPSSSSPQSSFSTPLPRVAVVGCGRWGKNLVRTFHRLGALAALCDTSPEALVEALEVIPAEDPYPLTTTQFNELLSSEQLDGIVIATPSHTHAALASQALAAGKHVYVEKPLATTTADVEALMAQAQAAELTLMVGHLLLYHPAVHRLKTLVAEGVLGDIHTITSTRLNFNAARPDASVLWDLAPHDISLMAEVLGRTPMTLDRVDGVASGVDGKIDQARMTLRFDGYPPITGEVVNSWIYPVKAVQLSVIGSKAIALLDDAQPTNKLLILDRATGETTYPEVLTIEPLLMECQHFLHCIQSGTLPNTSAAQGHLIVALLEEAHKRLAPALTVV
ncbi:MAG: Gfo/Idh/MocA family oxidoreductase [Vampirovibrionales bacterium]